MYLHEKETGMLRGRSGDGEDWRCSSLADLGLRSREGAGRGLGSRPEAPAWCVLFRDDGVILNRDAGNFACC